MDHKQDSSFVSLHYIFYFTCIIIKKGQGVELCHFRGIRVTQVKNMSAIHL